MKLSKKALEVLKAVFSEQSGLQLPVSVADQVLEIRTAVNEELDNDLAKPSPDEPHQV